MGRKLYDAWEDVDMIPINRSEAESMSHVSRKQPSAQRKTPHPPQRQRTQPNRIEEQHMQRTHIAKRRRKKKIRRLIFRLFVMLCMIGIGLFAAYKLFGVLGNLTGSDYEDALAKVRLINENESDRPEMTEDLIPINEYSGPGEELKEVNSIFIHYTANTGTTAEQNRRYFASLAETGERSASAHFVIGYDGTIIQCVPLDEIAYAVKGRNNDSISIECCYTDADGRFTKETYDALLKLTGWLMKEYELSPEEVLRHYDEGGKKCPLYYVEHEDAWEQFRADLTSYIQNGA